MSTKPPHCWYLPRSRSDSLYPCATQRPHRQTTFTPARCTQSFHVLYNLCLDDKTQLCTVAVSKLTLHERLPLNHMSLYCSVQNVLGGLLHSLVREAALGSWLQPSACHSMPPLGESGQASHSGCGLGTHCCPPGMAAVLVCGAVRLLSVAFALAVAVGELTIQVPLSPGEGAPALTPRSYLLPQFLFFVVVSSYSFSSPTSD